MANQFSRKLKFVAGMFIPYSLVKLRQQRAERQQEQQSRRYLANLQAQQQSDAKTYTYDAAVQALQSWGLDPVQVIQSSIPSSSLDLCATVLSQYLAPARPLRGLHIGNFVGVSAGYFLSYLAARDANALLISIDPNIPHRNIENPQQYVMRLAAHFGLTKQHLLIAGYTLEQNIAQYEPFAPEAMAERMTALPQQAACENVLSNLAQLGLRFDFVVIDGNHDAVYLARELAVIRQLLAETALLILDDVNARWDQIEKLYETVLARDEFVQVGRDDRLGILLKQPHD